MRVIVKDFTNINKNIKPYQIHQYCKSTGEYRLVNGLIYTEYELDAVRYGTEQKLFRAYNSMKLATTWREQSKNNANMILDAVKILEKQNEK